MHFGTTSVLVFKTVLRARTRWTDGRTGKIRNVAYSDGRIWTARIIPVVVWVAVVCIGLGVQTDRQIGKVHGHHVTVCLYVCVLVRLVYNQYTAHWASLCPLRAPSHFMSLFLSPSLLVKQSITECWRWSRGTTTSLPVHRAVRDAQLGFE